MIIAELPSKDSVHRYNNCIVVPFSGKRRVLSTSPLNGGYQEKLTAVFNNDMNPGPGMACRMLADTYEKHLEKMAEELGLDPETSSGISTSASMENVSIHTERFRETAVTAVVTAGIEVNGGRVGDPASWSEVNGQAAPVRSGTINILLFFNVDLSRGALARALVTCTEAKTAALQELLAPSRYSTGLATGSGTDGTIVVCDAEAPACLTDAGKHSKLGELIGKSVMGAVKEALQLQTGLSAETQHDVLRRTDRFGITEQSLWESFREKTTAVSRADFSDRLFRIRRQNRLVTMVSLYVHLMDQLLWGLLSAEEVLTAGRNLLCGMRKPDTEAALSVWREEGCVLAGGREKNAPETEIAGAEGDAALAAMICDLKEFLNSLILE